MTRVTCLLAFLAWSGCGWWGGPPEIGEAVDLTEPWVSLSLPLEAGTVTMSEPESLTARHPGDDVERVLGGYIGALKAAGWSLQADTSVPGVVNQTWTHGEQTMALSGMTREGQVKVSLSVLPF